MIVDDLTQFLQVSGVSPAAGQKNGRSNRKRKLIFDRINQSSLKSFALAGRMDRIEKYKSKINPDNPARPGIA